MGSSTMRSGTWRQPGRWVTAAAGLLLPVSIVVAPATRHAVPAPGRAAAAASPASSLPTCPSTQFGFSELRQSYGASANGQGLDVDVYQPAASGGKQPPPTVPGVILVHGGEWITGNFEGGEGTATTAGDGLSGLAECFAQNGFDAFSIDYALTGTNNAVSEQGFPQNLEDIHNAIAWVKANVSNLDTAKILILGQSAGGNLADLAAENAMGYSDGLLGAISQSGPAGLTALGAGCTNTTTCPGGSVGGIVHNYLGCYETAASCTLEFGDGTKTTVSGATAYSEASPAASLSTTVPAPPFLLFNSSDEIIPLAQATAMAQAASAQCAATHAATSEELVALPGDQHAATYSDLVAGPALDFLNAVVGKTLPAGCGIASPVTGAATAYDVNTSAKAVIGFGGCCTAAGAASATTQVFSTATGTWKPVTVTGTAPSARLGAAFGYDATNGKLVLFGGESLPGGSAQPQALDDTWEFSYAAATNTGTWTQADTGTGCPTACPGAPPARYAAAADEAPHTQGLVLFGGESVVPANKVGAATAYGDTWLWNGTAGTWTSLSPSGASGVVPRYGAVMAFYGPGNTDVLFGGNQGASTTFCNKNGSCLDPLNDTWKLTYNTTAKTWAWASGGTAPAGLLPRAFAAGASSATGMTVFGGLNGSGTGSGVTSEQIMGDTWAWNSTSGWAQPCSPCSPVPPPGEAAAMAYHRGAAEGVLYGGYTDAAAPAAPTATWIWTGTAWHT